MLGKADQLLCFVGVASDLAQGVLAVPARKSRHDVSLAGHARAKSVGVGAHLLQHLGRAAGVFNRLLERSGFVFEQIQRPGAQLHDAGVASAQLFWGVGDLVVVELVELECLGEVVANGAQRIAQLLCWVVAEFGRRKQQLVGGQPHPLVGLDEGLLCPQGKTRILRIELLLLCATFTPKTCHFSILCARDDSFAESDAVGPRRPSAARAIGTQRDIERAGGMPRQPCLDMIQPAHLGLGLKDQGICNETPRECLAVGCVSDVVSLFAS